MKRICAAVVFAAVLSVLGVSAALADGGPHGGYINPISVANSTFSITTINTDACAGCHRVHTAQANDHLLRLPTEYQLCTDCHNGTGSVLDVLDGKRLSALAATPPGSAATGGDLNGGGFNFQRGHAVTSRHPVNSGITQAWGAGTADPGVLQSFDLVSNGDGTAASLDCTSCHDPHGSPNYRLLNPTIGGIWTGTDAIEQNVNALVFAPTTPTGTTPAFTKDEFGPGIQTGTPATKYTVAYYASYGLDANSGTTLAGCQAGSTRPCNGGFFYGSGFNATNLNTRNAAITPGLPASGSPTTGIALVCGACHTAYPSPNATDLSYPTGNYLNPTVGSYRHQTEAPWFTWDGWTSADKNPAVSWSVTATAGPQAGHTVTSVALRLASSGASSGTYPPPTGAPNTYGNQQIVTCLTCHNAHGSSSQETGFALSKALGGTAPQTVSPAQASATDMSTLLVADNRAMCEACHQKATPWNNQ